MGIEWRGLVASGVALGCRRWGQQGGFEILWVAKEAGVAYQRACQSMRLFSSLRDALHTTRRDMPPKKPSGKPALLADLSRTFFALRRLDVRLDYESTVVALQGDGPPFSPLTGYTVFDPSNEAQSRLHARLEQSGWYLATERPNHVRLVNGTVSENESKPDEKRPIVPLEHNVRFDADISFALARLAGVSPRVVVMSDSYALSGPVLQTIDRGTRVEIAFFEDELDSRWWQLFKEHPEMLAFRDLEPGPTGSSHRKPSRQAHRVPGLR